MKDITDLVKVCPFSEYDSRHPDYCCDSQLKNESFYEDHICNKPGFAECSVYSQMFYRLALERAGDAILQGVSKVESINLDLPKKFDKKLYKELYQICEEVLEEWRKNKK